MVNTKTFINKRSYRSKVFMLFQTFYSKRKWANKGVERTFMLSEYIQVYVN